MKQRNRVPGMICALMTILMLDRICLSVAGPHMPAGLPIGPVVWGWVNAVFAIAFACFESRWASLATGSDRAARRQALCSGGRASLCSRAQ